MAWRTCYSSKPKYSSIEEYLENTKPTRILNGQAELRRIGRATGLHILEVRGALKRLNYKLETNFNGISQWRLSK